MVTEHTPEPWFVSDVSSSCVTSDPAKCAGWPPSKEVIASLDDGEYIANPRAEADARRIVACVNACRSITTEELENDCLVWAAIKDV